MRGELNSRERWGLLLIDEFPDRPPVWPLITSHAAEVFGCDLASYSTSGRILAEAQIAAQQYYGHEGLSVFTDVGILAEAYGSVYAIQTDDLPQLTRPLFESPEQIVLLDSLDPSRSGRLPLYLEAVERLFSAKGDVLPVFAFIPAPFTTAGGLRGVEGLLMDTVVAPETVHTILEIALDGAIKLADACTVRGALPVIVDPLASGSVISRRTFTEFALPYLQRLIRHLHRYDLDVTLHICGRTATHLDLIAQTGADLFSFDQVGFNTISASPTAASRLVGNLPPHELQFGAGGDLTHDCSAILTAGCTHPRGFVFSTGCEAPVNSDPDRIRKMIEIGRATKYCKSFSSMELA